MIFREGLKRVLAGASHIDLAGECGDGRKALQAILKSELDLVLLDLALPGMDGLDVLRELKARKPDLPVLVLSMYPEEQYAIRVLKEGASGYLSKESVPKDLISAIRKATSGRRYISSSLGEKFIIGQLNGESDKLPHESLSNREFQVFRMVVKGRPIKEIAYDTGLARTTVTSYRSRVLEKMKMKTNADLICYALKNNLIQ